MLSVYEFRNKHTQSRRIWKYIWFASGLTKILRATESLSPGNSTHFNQRSRQNLSNFPQQDHYGFMDKLNKCCPGI